MYEWYKIIMEERLITRRRSEGGSCNTWRRILSLWASRNVAVGRGTASILQRKWYESGTNDGTNYDAGTLNILHTILVLVLVILLAFVFLCFFGWWLLVCLLLTISLLFRRVGRLGPEICLLFLRVRFVCKRNVRINVRIIGTKWLVSNETYHGLAPFSFSRHQRTGSAFAGTWFGVMWLNRSSSILHVSQQAILWMLVRIVTNIYTNMYEYGACVILFYLHAPPRHLHVSLEPRPVPEIHPRMAVSCLFSFQP